VKKRWKEFFVVLFVVIPLMAVIWLPILSTDTKPWDAGNPVPVEPPSDDRRVRNDAGFSVVSPPNWNASNERGRIHLTPKQVFAGRSKAGLFVSEWPELPESLTQFEETEFLGRVAHLKVELRRSTFDDPALTTWTYLFQHNEKWIEVSYFIAEWYEEMPEMAMRYLETIKMSNDP
jgi:hypothetical protein